jgi:hypothetical protein
VVHPEEMAEPQQESKSAGLAEPAWVAEPAQAAWAEEMAEPQGMRYFARVVGRIWVPESKQTALPEEAAELERLAESERMAEPQGRSKCFEEPEEVWEQKGAVKPGEPAFPKRVGEMRVVGFGDGRADG